jgi:hypothetical protein
MKWILALALVAIVAALALAGRAMLRNPDASTPAPRRMMRALAWRVGLSVALFVFIWLAYQLGWIQPTGLPIDR